MGEPGNVDARDSGQSAALRQRDGMAVMSTVQRTASREIDSL
jgi:hypothetical protein